MESRNPSSRDFSLKCECSLQKNSIPQRLNSKSKFLSVILRPPRSLLIVPYACAEVLAQYDVGAVRAIHRRFIEEGKLTVEICEGYTVLSVLASDVSLDKPVRKDLLTHIFISNAIKQNLELFVARLTEMIKDIKPTDSLIRKPQEKVERASELAKERPQKLAEKQKSRRSMLK